MDGHQDDRRVQTRTIPHCELKVFDLESGELLGRVGDLTTGGMRLLCDRPMIPGQTYHFRLAVPADLLGYPTNIVFDAVCGRCTRDAHQECCVAGFYDLTAEPGNIDAIEMLILRFSLARS
jgi:hypothetical protein